MPHLTHHTVCIAIWVEPERATPTIGYAIAHDGVIKHQEELTNSDLFHERVEEALGNILRPVTNSAVAELRKLRRKSQSTQP